MIFGFYILGIFSFFFFCFYFYLSAQEVSMRRSQSSVASTVPELPGLFDKQSLVEESADDLVQGVFHGSLFVIFLKDISR